MGKGSHRRPEDTEAYRENFDRVFRKPWLELTDREKTERLLERPKYEEDMQPSGMRGPSCRDPKNCTGSCVRDPACNE